MKNFVCFLALFLLFPLSGLADRDSGQQVILQKKKSQINHGGFIMADTPDAVYYDSDEMEIIIEADGVSQYYDVEIVSDSLNQTVILTQVSGYGDTIDVSSLPTGSYTIIFTSPLGDVYEGTFYTY